MVSPRWIAQAGLLACSVVLMAAPAQAQLDRVYPTNGSAITGQVVNIVPDGLQIRPSGGAVQDFRIDQLDKVTFEGDPGPLTRGRELAIDGQYQSALEQLKTIDLSSLRRDYIVADAMFYRALSEARLALAGQGDKSTAIKSLRSFATRYPKSMHFYKTAELLGDLAIATGDYDNASKFYNALSRSAAPLLNARAQYLGGLAELRKGEPQAAVEAFDQVSQANLDTTEGLQLKALARAGKALAMARNGDGQGALDEANTLVAELNPDDVQLAARVYNARGAAHEALGDPQAALLDYLHTQLLFSSVADAHAEALSRLVTLWPEVGQPEKAARARQELQTRYPGWGG